MRRVDAPVRGPPPCGSTTRPDQAYSSEPPPSSCLVGQSSLVKRSQRQSAGAFRAQRDAGFHHAPYGADDYRNGRKNSRRSFTSTSGCSIAAKWPPRSTSVQWVMLYDASAQRRGVMNSS